MRAEAVTAASSIDPAMDRLAIPTLLGIAALTWFRWYRIPHDDDTRNDDIAKEPVGLLVGQEDDFVIFHGHWPFWLYAID